MKKIFSYAMLLLAGAFVLMACEDDNDSNPTLRQPTNFVLNAPEVGEGLVDLAKSGVIKLTWSQPTPYNNFNAPVVPTYTVQLSTTNSFTQEFDENLEDNTGADFISLSETYSTGNVELACEVIGKALQQLNQWPEDAVPATVDLTFRVKSALRDASFAEYYTINSNVQTVRIIPYYIELSDADVELWHLIGGDIGDGSWGNAVPTQTFPMEPVKDAEYDKKTGQGEIQWIGYLGGNGFKLKQFTSTWDYQWGQGSAFGEFVKNDGGSGNITVPTAGVYKVLLNTATDALVIEEYTESVSSFGAMYFTGSFNGWGTDNPMTAVHAVAGANNHDWYININLTADDEVKFYDGTSGWDFNRGGSLSNRTDGYYGFGTQGGPNIVIPETGSYLVIFNDITGYYRFIKQ